MTEKLAAISVNHDSIRECLKLVGIEAPPTRSRIRHTDSTYFCVMDRLLAIADRYGAKLTIFVIGRDLEHREVARKVRRWAEMGHEIGNHSFSHHQHMAEMSESDIRSEVSRAHDIIASAVAITPRGFIAPAWSYAPVLPKVLASLGYRYDTSLFPSILMPLTQWRLRRRSRVASQRIPLLRKDLRGSLYGSRQPFFATPRHPWRSRASAGDVVMLPLPTTPLRLPISHTKAFAMSRRLFQPALRSAIVSSNAFYYLLHPVDVVDRFYSVNKVARVFGIPVVSVHSMDAEDTVRLLGSAGSGVVFAQVSRLVPPRLLRCAEFWNKHCAPLPSYGGVLPVLWAMSRGERRLGVTIHRMNERFDEGPVLSQAEIDAAGRTFFDAYHDLYDLGADLLMELARDGRRRTITQGLPRSYFGWPDAAIRREFRLRGRFGRAFRLHPRVPPQRATTRC